jgi:glycerate 2-kinase
MKLNEMPGAGTTEHWAVLSAGTDGVDGNSKAAGAVADETTIARAKCCRLESSDFLERSDAFHFFEQLGDLIVTAPTGTNVRDVRIVLIGSGVSTSQ